MKGLKSVLLVAIEVSLGINLLSTQISCNGWRPFEMWITFSRVIVGLVKLCSLAVMANDIKLNANK